MLVAASSLRPARAFAIRFPPAILAQCSATTASFSSTTRPTKIQRTDRSSFASPPTKPAVRYASSAPGASPASANTQSTASSASSNPQAQLTWNDFLALRRTRRKISVAASSVSAIATTYAGLQVFINQGYDAALSASFGLDPLMVTGLSTIGMLAVGWLIGPFFGNAIFNMRYRAIRGEIERVSHLALALFCRLLPVTEQS